MATRAPARPAPQTNAVVAQTLTPEEFTALLQQTGMLAQGSTSDFHRMSLRGGMLITDPGTQFEESWPPVKNGPTMRVRIVSPPKYYNAFFCSEDEKNGAFDARKIGRGDLNGKFLKKYDDPADQAADQYANLDGYEAVSAFLGGKRGKFTADIELQIVPESGQLTGEEPVYTFSMAPTTALDFRGTIDNPNGGTVQEKNFIVQLGEFAMKQALEANPNATKADLSKAVLEAMTMLRLGGVVADIFLIGATSPTDKSISWTVAAFVPVFIDSQGEEAPALPDPTTVGPEQNGDDQLPF